MHPHLHGSGFAGKIIFFKLVYYGTRQAQKTLKRYLCLYCALSLSWGGSVGEWLACWSQAQKGLGLNRSRDAVTVLGKLFTPGVPLFTKQRNWWQPS